MTLEELHKLEQATRGQDSNDPSGVLRAYTQLDLITSFADRGELELAAKILEREGRATESFVYCINLAERAHNTLQDEKLTARLYAYALEYLADHGLADPITDDVEEEDNYHAEIANSMNRTLGESALVRKTLIDGAAAVDWSGGGDLGHLLFVSLGVSREFTLELVEAVAQRFEDDGEEWSSWATLAEATVYYTGAVDSAKALVARAESAALKERPAERDAVGDEAGALREQLESMKGLGAS